MINEPVRRSALQRLTNIDEFPTRLRNYRISAGLTIIEMANVLGYIHPSTIIRWEQGHTIPKSKIIISKLNDMGII